MTKKMILVPIILAAVSACSDGTTDPASLTEIQGPEYPLVEGTYRVEAAIDEMPGARFTGTITLSDASRSTPEFTGGSALKVTGPNGEESRVFAGNITGTVETDGAIRFVSRVPPAPDHTWTGILSGSSISGTHSIVAADGSSFSGEFTANRN